MKAFKYILLAAGAIAMASCSEIKDGVNDMDSWEMIAEPQVYTIQHPAMLHNQADINYIREHLDQGVWAEAWTNFETSPFSDVNRAANPTPLISRCTGYAECPHNAVNFGRDCATIYQLALRWVLKDDAIAAARAVANIKAWAENCNGIHDNNDSNQQLILFQIYQFANGMELLRNYNGYGESQEFKDACKWLVDKFYPRASDFLIRHNNTHDHYWLNWDLSSMTAILSMGILTDNQDMINEAIIYFKNGIGAGNYLKAANAVFTDPDTGIKIAQCNESGRDQGHCTMCAVLMGHFCQMALNIGEDLFAWDDYRMIAMAEYIAKYNTPRPGITTPGGEGDFLHTTASLPYTPYVWCPDGNCPTGERKELGSGGRGTKRPGWEVYLNYAAKHNIRTVYIDEMAEYLRPDGAAATYDSNTGGFDQLGCSTLMFYREKSN